MMFSAEKCAEPSTGTSEGAELLAGVTEGPGKEGVPPDEVASAVASVSQEIGDILKDELGDADRADRIGAELENLSAELGMLAGLADHEPQQDFPSLFEIAMGNHSHSHRVSGSGTSSSSSWSGSARRPARPQRTKRRPIAKGKEISRRRSAAARRAASLRVRRVEVVSDASDVGAESDDSEGQWTELEDACEYSTVPAPCRGRVEVVSDASDVGAESDDSEGQWTELEDACSSECSSSKRVAEECNGYQEQAEPEPPAMGQFLLPLLSAEPAPEPERALLIRHEDILQAVRLAPLHLLTSNDDIVPNDVPLEEEAPIEQTDSLSEEYEYEEPPVTPEEEAALLHYVCEAERLACSQEPEQFTAVEEWLLGVYHAWCEISALMYTLIGANMSVEMVREDWVYRARFGCHCRLCLCLANNAEALARVLRPLLTALARGSETIPTAVALMRALSLSSAAEPCRYAAWQLSRLKRHAVHETGLAIIHEHLLRLETESELTRDIVNQVCLCRPVEEPLQKENAMERLFKILENFKAASTITFKVDIVPPLESGTGCAWAGVWRARLARYLAPFQRCSTAARLRDMMSRPATRDLSAWSGYQHRCDCLTPRTVCAQQRKLLLRISFFGMMQAVNEFNSSKEHAAPIEPAGQGLQQGDGTGAKPPDTEGQPATEGEGAREQEEQDSDKSTGELDDLSESDGGSGSLGLSSSSLDSASELLLAAAAAVESGSEDVAPGSLCRTVRHLMRSIASIERLMDRVLQHCDEWPAAQHCRRGDEPPDDRTARKKVDMGLSEVDRKLMAMYRRLPEVHRRQLQVYRKQKKLSTVCMQLVGGRAPAPPPPGSPPPAPQQQACRALCPEYHLQRFKEVRRKVMHMRDQQLYYHRLRMWLEEQLRNERERERDSMPESNVTLVDDIPRRKRRSSSPKQRLGAAPKRKLAPPSRPHRILQMLKHKAPAQLLKLKDDDKPEVEPPEAFPLDKEDNVSDTETIVGEKETELCKEMKECLVKFASFALNSLDKGLQDHEQESVSPPLQEMSPTTSEPMPVYTPKPSQRLLQVNKFLPRDDLDFQPQIAPEVLNVPLNVPLNARRTPVLVEEEDKCIKVDEKDPNVYKYVTFGLEIKKAMEECQNIINSYNSINKEEGKDEQDGPLSLEQICEVMMSLDKNSAEFLEKMDSDEPFNTANTKIVELVENMPQILANMPEIASKLSEFANASFELPEFASIMNSLPEVNNEAQLTPETLRQIRELKLNKNKDSVKVTKNTAKRKTRKIKSNVEHDDIIGTMTLEFDSQDITELLKDEKDLQAIMKNKNNKEDLKISDLLFSISAQVVINKVFEYLKQNKSPELAKCLEDDINKDIFNTQKNSINSEMYSKASTLFDNFVKDALSMDQLRELVKDRFNSMKHYVATKFKGIPVELLENEIEAMLEKFYTYIQDLAGKQNASDSDKIIEKIEELNKNSQSESDSESCPASKESLKQISKLLSTSAGNTFDLLIMKLSKMSQDKKTSVKSLKFKYIDVIKRCADSVQLTGWILLNPEIASNVIEELTGIQGKNTENVPDFLTMPDEEKKEYFLDRLKGMNKSYMDTLPKDVLSGDEWLVMLYRLEKLEGKIKESFTKLTLPKSPATQASEAEILAAKGLSKIIGKANARVVKKPEPKIKKEEKIESKETEQDKKSKNEALLAKCEAILTSKGEKSLLDSFYTIKSYITQGLPVPESYKKHVISICSSIDAKLLDDDIQETLKLDDETEDKDKTNLSVIGSQNPELLAKYSAQALRNAKQTLNAVAFRNMMRNGQTKSESDACDTPKTDCKWTNDCICNSCKDNDNVCIGEIVKQCYDDGKNKTGLEEKKKEVKVAKPAVKPAAKPKVCENASHQQHVCKVGHSNGANACAGDGAADQPCTCCYCTVFGHAPPLTTPVPRNFNETRERLRSILNKKKQKCRTANGSASPVAVKPVPAKPVAAKPVVAKPVAAKPVALPEAPKPVPAPPTPKPPALPKTLPLAGPPLTAAQTHAQLKRQGERQPDKMAAVLDKMADMSVSDDKPKALQRTVPVQVNVPPALKAEGKVNPNAMEQIRIQQLKQQQQQAAFQQQQRAAPQPAPAQQKPEPIYDLPIHNKPTLTPQQQQQIQRQQQLQQQLQQQRQSRPAAQQVSLSSRDTSVFSTSSGCSGMTSHSGGGCWRGAAQDPRDLDALLQYIEGPARHVDRGKKRAKKQRQRGKRVRSTCIRGGGCWRGAAQDPRDLDALLQYIEGPARHVDRGKKRAKKQRQRGNGGGCWRGAAQDPRDLDALLQYIEGPARHVDRGKKRAKKQRQRGNGGGCWRGAAQDPRDLDALLQYIEGPARHVDRGKKRAKKQRQRGNGGGCWRGAAQDPRDLDALLQYIEGPARHVDRGKKRAKKQRQRGNGGGCWRGAAQDPRDLDALLQYIEGPARHVDRGKKRAKKQRQRAAAGAGAAPRRTPATWTRCCSTSRARRGTWTAARSAPRNSARGASGYALLVYGTRMTWHSGGGCWRGAAQDPRDLDALLQYIEGPARHVDRGKKRAKKQRQRGKRMEVRLLEEHTQLATQLNRTRLELRAMQARHMATARQAEEAKAQLKQTQAKKKGKKQKMNPAQQAKTQLIAEQLGELNTLLNATAKEVAEAERQVSVFAKRFEECERQLALARSLQGDAPRPPPPGPAPAHRHMEAAMLQHQQQQQHQQQLQQQFAAAHLLVSDKMDRQKQKAFIMMHAQSPPAPAPASPPRKQTWEQALAHINQLAKGSTKEKKKQKESEKPKPVEVRQREQQRSHSLPDNQPLSKKQRKLLAKQQAEEEERKRQQQLQKQEAKSKRDKDKKPDPPKPEPKKADKRDTKKQEPVKKEDKKDKKKDKGKEIKQEKAAPQPAPTAKQTKQSKKEKKEQRAQVINITADTTIEVVSKKGSCGVEHETPASCSIMEQLSCGVQVSDLRLPPGITLTRVQPNDKKEPAPIKSVPLWKAHALGAAPTPVARPAPVINADPAAMMFTTQHPEQPKTIIIPEPAPQPGRSKKAKKKAKKAAAAEAEPKPDGTKMVTLRNPMFHPNIPNPVKKPEIRIPDPIPMPPNACQATITPTSNGMYTIRNPLMSMMHQQSMMGQQATPMYGQQYNYVNPNTYTPVQTVPNPQAYVLDPSITPKQDEFQNRIMNLASFTQKNDEGYSLFKTNEDNQQKNFLTPEYYLENPSPKPVVSPNPIGTRPNNDSRFDSNESSLFTNTVRPEPIGTPLKQENDYAGLYTPFGQEDRNVFRNALFNDNNVPSYGSYDDVTNQMVNGDPLPYFQRLRVGSKLNNEVTIHHVTESKFYKGQDGCGAEVRDESLFSRPAWPSVYPRPQPVGVSSPSSLSGSGGGAGSGSGSGGSGAGSPPDDDARFGPVQRPAHPHHPHPHPRPV
ncbi:uncharacterized protein LOC134660034 [Cydia amplana]|uniref:uncharacterized protein LOC134660034 n=1 Tax=Cydia amplana TaxID=1869771 RepID=UPI002FE59D4F